LALDDAHGLFIAANVLHCRQLGALETVCLAVMLKRNVMMKLSKCLLERVMPQTAVAMLLLLNLQCPAPNCGNALLPEVLFYSEISEALIFFMMPFSDNTKMPLV